MILLNGTDILDLFLGEEKTTLGLVRRAYEAHHRGESDMPSSPFLRFPNMDRERIIALPAYLDGGIDAAGLKWIASFPDNVKRGMERASATILMNSTETGHLTGILEGSVISAKRTAASAALAASELHRHSTDTVLLVGCGLINFEVAGFLAVTHPSLSRFVLCDLDESRAEQLGLRLTETINRPIEFETTTDVREALGTSSLISFATTVVEPHISSLASCPPGTTVLHISLRDLTPEVILKHDNVADDIDHVCRAQTSVHLAEQRVGHRDFMRCTLADVTTRAVPPRASEDGITIFSPFGMGILDVALAQFAIEKAKQQGVGQRMDGFLPPAWTDRAAMS